MIRILKYVMLDIIKNKLVVVYTILLALLSWSLFSLEDNSAKAVLSLTNVVLLVVPLVTVIFYHLYVQCIRIYWIVGQSTPTRIFHLDWFFPGTFICVGSGVVNRYGLAFIFIADFSMATVLLTTGVMMSLIFVSLGFMGICPTRDKARVLAQLSLYGCFYCDFDGFNAAPAFSIFRLSHWENHDRTHSI